MARKKKEQILTNAAPVDSYKHTDTRTRIPTQEESEKLSPKDKRPTKTRYQYDPSLDPQLVWAGKAEAGGEFGVSTVPIYVQEKIAPEAIIARLKAGSEELAQNTLFGDTAIDQFNKAVAFYEHEDNWQNRMILGDSLLVMNSLLEKEGMRGKVQCIYIDPPYGIKFGSNWQVSTRKRDVKDNKVEDMVRQPEQVKAFRDTWELGIHSYLSYLRDRLVTARELLTESGSCFVQISDENLHHVRELMDEIFGAQNFFAQINYRSMSPLGQKGIAKVYDYIVWYAKDISKVKFRPLYVNREMLDEPEFCYLDVGGAAYKKLTRSEIQDLPQVQLSKIFKRSTLTSSGYTPSCTYDFNFEEQVVHPASGKSWRTHKSGMEKLIENHRLIRLGKSVYFRQYHSDFPLIQLENSWHDTAAGFSDQKVYVVQTHEKIIQRCLLMTTDPGDIVIDPTCGSGTTAFTAEQWGRRWITTDTSRVALALARTRLMTARFQWFKLRDEKSVRSGFEYKTVPHITLKTIANAETAEYETLFDQPIEEKERVRVSGPFTVESLSPHRVSDAGEMLSTERFIETVVANLMKAGVQTGDREGRLEFTNLDILPSGPEVQAAGEYQTNEGLKKVAVAIGPEFGSIDDDFVRSAVRVSKKFADLLVVAGTSFEASAFTESGEVDGLRVMKVKINPDLSMGDLLKKTGAGNLFLAFGEPEVKVTTQKEGCVVEVVGVDVYDPVKNEIRSSGSGDADHEIAAWFIDTNYNDEAFFVTHAYFLGADKPYEKLKKALKADISEEAWNELYSTTSRPFPCPKTGKIAVKVINHYGDEVMKVVTID